MFLVCGEALFDVFYESDSDTGMRLDARLGGSPFNVAVGLSRLEQPVALLTGVAEDFFAHRLRRALREEGVSEAFLQPSGGKTTLSTVGLAADGSASYVFYGESGAERDVHYEALPDLAGLSALHIGSYALVSEPSGETFLRLAAELSSRCLVSLDPNVRLNVVPDKALWRRRIGELAAHAHVIKASDEDLELLWPERDIEQLVAEWLGLGVALVVITRGADGVLAATAQHRVSQAAVAVEVVDTVGAGDTYQAALLTALAERGLATPAAIRALSPAQLEELLDFAARAAAITCGRRGANLPRRNEGLPE